MAEPRPSVGPMDGRPSTMLVRRNREIAEVREEHIRQDTRLDAAQAKNAVLLEETSVLDSQITAQCARSGFSEQRLAELFYQAEKAEHELFEQQAAQRAALSVLQGEASLQKEQLARMEAEADSARSRTADVGADLGMLQGQLQAEQDALALAQRTRTEDIPTQRIGNAASGAVVAAAQALADELEAIRARQTSQKSEAILAQRRSAELREDLSAERQKRDVFSNELRAAVADQAGDPGRFQTLEAAVATRGGNARAVLEDLLIGQAESEIVASRTAELRNELQSSEEQCKSLQVSFERSRERKAQDEARDRAKLDSARNQLQRSLSDASEAHGKEVARLEDEIMTERQQAANDALAERACIDQNSQLELRKSQLKTESCSASLQAHNDAGRGAALNEEIKRVRAEVQAVEQRTEGFQQCQVDIDRRKREALAEEERQAAILRRKLEELWLHLRMAQTPARYSH